MADLTIQEAFAEHSRSVSLIDTDGKRIELVIKPLNYSKLLHFFGKTQLSMLFVGRHHFAMTIVNEDAFPKFLQACFGDESVKVNKDYFTLEDIFKLIDVFCEVNRIDEYISRFQKIAEQEEAKKKQQ